MTLLGFMSQKYGQNKPVWQNTNFVVFDELFKSVHQNGTGKNVIIFGRSAKIGYHVW